jgi:hypothetical protein
MSNIDKEISQLGTAAGDITSSTKTSASSLKKLVTAFKDIANISKSAFSAIRDTSTDTSKWAGLITSTSNALTHVSGTSSKTGMAITLFIKGLESATNAYLKQVDALNNAYDGLESIGATAKLTTVDFENIGTEAGRYIENIGKLGDSIVNIGPALRNLGPDTSTAAKRLGKIFSTHDTQLEFLRLGVNPDRMLEIQSEAIKYLTGYTAPMENDDIKIKKATLEYAKSLTVLTSMTGETRDQTAKRLADLRLDATYQMQKTLMIRNGNEKEAKEMDKAMVTLGTVSADIAKGFSDFLANGQATTDEGNAMMYVTRGKAREIAEGVKTGRISGAEGTKMILKYYQEFMQNQKKNLIISDEYAKQTGISGKVLERTDQILSAKSEKEVEELIKNMAAKDDDLKKTEDTRLDTERTAGQLKNKLVESFAGIASTVFKFLIGVVRSVAYYAAASGAWISGGELKNAFEEIQIMLGDKNQLKKKHDDISLELKQVGLKIRTVERIQERITKQEKDIEILEKVNKTTPNDPVVQATIKAAKTRLQEEKNVKQTLLGKDSYSDLVEKRQQLMNKEASVRKQGTGLEGQEYREKKAEQQQLNLEIRNRTSTVDISEASKYIKFTSRSGDLDHFNMLASKNKELSQRITLMAQEYYNATKEKLELNSSFRTVEEQQELYDAWVRNNGGPNNPTVYDSKFGKITTPMDPKKGLGPHNTGRAVDVNKTQAEYLDKNGFLKKFGLKRPIHDPEHLQQLKQGGLVNGSNMIEMHGREALIALRDGGIPIDIDSMMKGSETPSPAPMTTPIQQQDDGIDLSLLSFINNQFDELILNVERSNIIHNDIKTYMAA